LTTSPRDSALRRLRLVGNVRSGFFGSNYAIEKEIDMNNPRPLHALAFALILSGALSGCATFGKCDSDNCRDDAKITSEVQTLLDRHRELGDSLSIQVQTRDRVVYLNGQLDDVAQADAASLAGQVPGVDGVVNSIATNN
jgi:BON domain